MLSAVLPAAWRLTQVGDIVRKCSAVFGEDMWHATDIRRMRWAINNRTSKVNKCISCSTRWQVGLLSAQS